ncbi:MAG: protein phosphatase 2C domain-containing protein [Desulfarculaceae bacterium]|nr:protein phosphatase 2C domain-containing protein [Desulfarculaceae bacterium]MCF8047408.1 protein phosphatase 2C domain-containing protein [Desulfarculaceae bacterium]MCF8065881.1 protein phosphatase 2C domain-containing protein [Desulfarculaceae bacterium]MCF8096670.1 protein phosphatase 2C domain-containing protein [Desulfarculaceae bacterium]
MRFFAQTHRGLKRPTNQDRYLARELPDGRVLAAVADGMGGMAGGEVAASMAVDLLGETMDPSPDSHVGLGEVFMSICRRVYAKAQAETELEGMGTTLTAVLASPERVDWAHVGDSRLYRWRGGSLIQLTSDDTAAAFMAEEGMIDSEEAAVHPARHVLFDCVGCGDCDPHTGNFRPEPGELLLLTSDGLHDKVSRAAIAEVLASGGDMDELVHALVELALATGGSDNITAVLVRV